MDPDVFAAMAPVVAVFEELGVRYHVGGSLASSAHGAPRSTRDVDLVADLVPTQIAAIARRLEADYYVEESAIRVAIARRSSFNVIHLGTMIKVDVFILGREALDQLEMDRARLQEIDDSPDARPYMVSSPEDIILRKLRWYRISREVLAQQMDDVVGVMRLQLDALDRSYLDRWAAELGVSDLLERARQAAAALDQD